MAGIITQMPLPPGIPLRTVIDNLDPLRDIDGIHPVNAGLLSLGYDGFLPATAHASVEILTQSGIELEGRHAVVIGRSNVVGKPTALLLLREDATVTICHSHTARPRVDHPHRRRRRGRRRAPRVRDGRDAQAGRGRRRRRHQRRRRAS